ncbi:peroxiredoxin [Cellulomonas sp. ICMP 17802]|uniref:peroxiredoxin n=1 Tax=Cellulomonas sp. ICMP 17802 TaxID=3239199 RepID=UPI00351B82DD
MEDNARPTPALGEPAPEFSLRDTHGTPVTLSGLRGGPVVIVFVPFAFSGTCTGELCELRDNISEFEEAGVHVLVVSCDPGHALRAWAAQEGFGFDLLSDFWPHGEVAKAYGVFDEEKGFAVRGSFLVDAEGVLQWSVVNPPGRARDFSSYRAALADLAA